MRWLPSTPLVLAGGRVHLALRSSCCPPPLEDGGGVASETDLPVSS